MAEFKIICAKCGKEVDFDSESPSEFCTYCGEKLTVDSSCLAETVNALGDSSPGIIAKDKKSEIVKVSLFAFLFFAIAGVLLIIYTGITAKAIPFSSVSAKGEKYYTVMSSLESAGFAKISLNCVNEKEYKGKFKDGEVVSVSVNGKTDYQSGKKFNSKSADIIVNYYSSSGKLIMPFSSKDFCDMDKDAAVKVLKKYGFPLIRETKNGNLLGLIAYHTFQVVSIDVDGKTEFEKGDMFSPDSTVTVNYYMPIK